MALADDAIAATELLTRDGTFSLGEVRQDEANFGNFVFVLTSKAGFCLRFVRDRGDVWCDIRPNGSQGGWYYLNDVLAVLGIDAPAGISDWKKTVAAISGIVKGNMSTLAEALSPNAAPVTIEKVRAYALRRVMGRFGTSNLISDDV